MALQTLKRDASVDQIIEVMSSDGALILEDVVDEQRIDHCVAELKHFIDVTPLGRDDFTGRLTKPLGLGPVVTSSLTRSYWQRRSRI